MGHCELELRAAAEAESARSQAEGLYNRDLVVQALCLLWLYLPWLYLLWLYSPWLYLLWLYSPWLYLLWLYYGLVDSVPRRARSALKQRCSNVP